MGSAGTRIRNDPRQYDALAAEWWRPGGVFEVLHWLAAARARLIPPAPHPGALLLDIGCGAGLLAPHVVGKGYRHVGVDLSAAALGQAAAHGVVPVRGDVQRLPFPDGCADVVAAGEILEHVPDLGATIAETARVLRPGGLIVLDTIADTALAKLVAVAVAERIVPKVRGMHDPALLVNRERLVAGYAGHGIQLELRGVVPSIRDTLAWLGGGTAAGRVTPIRSTAVLFQGRGFKKEAQ